MSITETSDIVLVSTEVLCRGSEKTNARARSGRARARGNFEGLALDFVRAEGLADRGPDHVVRLHSRRTVYGSVLQRESGE